MAETGCRVKIIPVVVLLALFCMLTPFAAAETYQFVRTWGSNGTGNGQFESPTGLSLDQAGNVYVSDTWLNRVQKFDSGGNFLGKWGVDGRPIQDSAPGVLTSAFAIHIDPFGNAYVADQGAGIISRIQKFTKDGIFITAWGSYGSGPGQFNFPWETATDSSGNVYVADSGNNRIQKFTADGTYLSAWGSAGSGDGQFNRLLGIAVDPSDNVFVVDAGNNRVQKFSRDGKFLSKWGSWGSGDGELNSPAGIATDAKGNVFIVDALNYRIQKFTNDGTFITSWGEKGTGSGQFIGPFKIAVDSQGAVYVLDYDTYNPDNPPGYVKGTNVKRIQKFALVPPTHAPLSVTGISPSSGTNDKSITATVTGTGFKTGAVVRLTLSGQPDIIATGVTLTGDTQITCTLDLTGKPAGTWNLAVTNPADGTTSVRSNAFVLTSPGPANTKGIIIVTSSPAGADIFIDGVLQQETTPNTFTDIEAGTHSVTVSKIGFLGKFSTVLVPAGESITVGVTLEPLDTGTGIISVRSTPPGASIVLDGKSTGKTTPYDLSGITPGTHTVDVTMVEYGTYTKTVTVDAGTTVVVTAPWSYTQKDAVVFFTSKPDGATVYIDDAVKGTTPISLHLRQGTYIIKMTKDGYKDDISALTVESGDVTEVRKALKTPGFEVFLALASLVVMALIARKIR